MTSTSTHFETFTTEHLSIVAGFLVVCMVVATVGRSHRGTTRELRFRRGFALLIPCFTVPLQVLQFTPSDYDLDTSLPLQLCDFAWVAAIVALWTRHWAATALVYFWGLTLTVQGIITPALSNPFPDPRYIGFWGMHFCTVWAAVYLTFGLRVPVTWRSYRFAVLVTACWAAAVMTFNAFVGTNYGYLNRKPAVGTLLDLFGPWPGYVVVEVALALTIWALMTWPWTRTRGQQALSRDRGAPRSPTTPSRGGRSRRSPIPPKTSTSTVAIVEASPEASIAAANPNADAITTMTSMSMARRASSGDSTRVATSSSAATSEPSRIGTNPRGRQRHELGDQEEVGAVAENACSGSTTPATITATAPPKTTKAGATVRAPASPAPRRRPPT